jgi:1-acyl-sn-glycerol-3-phosphate acyltransferase
MFYSIVTIYTWIYFFITLIVYFPIALLLWLTTFLFDKNLRALHVFTSFWGYSFLWINPFTKIIIEGKQNIKKGETYVMICNHQSLLDIVVLFGIFSHFKWVAKRELFKIPIVGWTMALNGYIPVDRANKLSHAKMFKACEDNLAMGNSIMIFPEGTRSEDAEIHSFKEGAFKMALVAQKPILPIILDGTFDSLPKKGFIFRKISTIRIQIHQPIFYSTFAGLSSKELTLKIKEEMVQNYQQLKKERPKN